MITWNDLTTLGKIVAGIVATIGIVVLFAIAGAIEGGACGQVIVQHRCNHCSVGNGQPYSSILIV